MEIEYKDGKMTVRSEEKSGELDDADKLINLLIEKTENDEIEWNKNYDSFSTRIDDIRVEIKCPFFCWHIEEPFHQRIPRKLVKSIKKSLARRTRLEENNKLIQLTQKLSSLTNTAR